MEAHTQKRGALTRSVCQRVACVFLLCAVWVWCGSLFVVSRLQRLTFCVACALQLTVQDRKDMNRQIVKSDTATISIPELSFEVSVLILLHTSNNGTSSIVAVTLRVVDVFENVFVLMCYCK